MKRDSERINRIKALLIVVISTCLIISISVNYSLYKSNKEKQYQLLNNAYKYENNEPVFDSKYLMSIDPKDIIESTNASINETNGEFTGERINGKKVGKGIYKWQDGTIYEGNFENDTINGQGKLTIPKVGTYEGEFKNGVRSGQGTFTFANKDVYTGEWEDDKMSGQGKYTFANGESYTGSFKNNKFNGQGTYKISYNSYSGTWKDNIYTGSN